MTRWGPWRFWLEQRHDLQSGNPKSFLGNSCDVHPDVGLALALRERGHDVLFGAPAIFRSHTQRVSLDFVEVLNKFSVTSLPFASPCIVI